MSDGSATSSYARIYEEQQPRLVAYARSLTRNAWAAEDLVAEAHFRVWRRLAAGHEIENVPAYLMTTVRHLATAAGSTARETPRDPQGEERVVVGRQGSGDDPADRVSSVDLLVRVLGQLPERWVKALWLSEAEGQPLAAIGPQLGTKEGATAVLLHRAREGMRQAFLRAQTGAPDDPACQVHFARMPAYVRGAATARQSERLLSHVDACAGCRARLASLMTANDRLPALTGPALLLLAVGGTAKFLLASGAGTAVAAGAGGHGGGVLHAVRHGMAGGAKAPVAVTAGAVVAGAAALCLVLGLGGSSPVPAGRAPVADAPVTRAPVTEAPTAAPADGARDAGSVVGRGGTPGRDKGVDETPTSAAPAAPADGPSGDTPSPSAPAPSSPAPGDTPPTGPAPSTPAPTDPTPSAPVTADPAPSDPVPTTDPSPSDPAPSESETPAPVASPPPGCHHPGGTPSPAPEPPYPTRDNRAVGFPSASLSATYLRSPPTRDSRTVWGVGSQPAWLEPAPADVTRSSFFFTDFRVRTSSQTPPSWSVWRSLPSSAPTAA